METMIGNREEYVEVGISEIDPSRSLSDLFKLKCSRCKWFIKRGKMCKECVFKSNYEASWTGGNNE